MSKRIDLTGQQFGRLTVISFAGTDKNGKALWNCQCECEKQIIVVGTDIRNGHTKSCGCLRNEEAKKAVTKHGETGERLWRIWKAIIYRTTNKNNKRSKDYIDRGIRVCNEWKNYKCFKKWAINNGYKEELTIDRIDNNKGYNPQYCRWVTVKTNNRNKRNTVLVEYRGERKPLIEIAEKKGINIKTVKTRIKRGWSVEKALETPVKKKKHCT